MAVLLRYDNKCGPADDSSLFWSHLFFFVEALPFLQFWLFSIVSLKVLDFLLNHYFLCTCGSFFADVLFLSAVVLTVSWLVTRLIRALVT